MKEINRILLAEDEAISAMCLHQEILDAGYRECILVSTGEKAIETALTQKIDLLLMDVHLGENVDGIDAAQAIFKKKKIPVIFMTGYSDAEIKNKALELDPVAYLEKPVHIQELNNIISKIK